MTNPKCIACKYSGVDDREFAAYGCPSCICNKPREWTQVIDESGDLIPAYSRGCIDGFEEVTVIEKSTYDQLAEMYTIVIKDAVRLQKERDEALGDAQLFRQRLDGLFGERDQLIVEINKLKSEMGILRKANAGLTKANVHVTDKRDLSSDLARKLKSQKDELQEVLDWVYDGLQHFNNDEDQSQREYLSKRIEEVLKK